VLDLSLDPGYIRFCQLFGTVYTHVF